MRPYQCGLRSKNVRINQVQNFTTPIIISITGGTGKVKIADLMTLKCFNNLPLVVIDDPVDLPEPAFHLTFSGFQPMYDFFRKYCHCYVISPLIYSIVCRVILRGFLLWNEKRS